MFVVSVAVEQVANEYTEEIHERMYVCLFSTILTFL